MGKRTSELKTCYIEMGFAKIWFGTLKKAEEFQKEMELKGKIIKLFTNK
jgi:hypothetical protein